MSPAAFISSFRIQLVLSLKKSVCERDQKRDQDFVQRETLEQLGPAKGRFRGYIVLVPGPRGPGRVQVSALSFRIAPYIGGQVKAKG